MISRPLLINDAYFCPCGASHQRGPIQPGSTSYKCLHCGAIADLSNYIKVPLDAPGPDTSLSIPSTPSIPSTFGSIQPIPSSFRPLTPQHEEDLRVVEALLLRIENFITRLEGHLQHIENVAIRLEGHLQRLANLEQTVQRLQRTLHHEQEQPIRKEEAAKNAHPVAARAPARAARRGSKRNSNRSDVRTAHQK